jgi:hypothetical protein
MLRGFFKMEETTSPTSFWGAMMSLPFAGRLMEIKFIFMLQLRQRVGSAWIGYGLSEAGGTKGAGRHVCVHCCK